MNKILVKAQIIALINSLQANYDINNTDAEKNLSELKKMDSYDFMMKILVNELFDAKNSTRIEIILFLLSELIPKDLLEDYVFSLLKSQLEDSKKYRLINVLRTIGKVLNYEMFTEFMTEPEKFINEDTKMLIQNSMVNPELQIDFIDFLHALNQEDRITLLDSLVDDYGGNTDPANLLIPLLYLKPESELFFKVIELLSMTKSQRALDALVLLGKQYEKSPQTVTKIKKAITLLKLSCKKHPLSNLKPIFDSVIYKCFISFPDGMDNFGLIISRKRADTSIQMFSVAVSLQDGILDAFGFNEILHYDFEQIVNKFYRSEKRIEIKPETAKMLLHIFEEKNISKLKPVSYEYICWRILLDDIDENLPESVFAKDTSLKLQPENNFVDKLMTIAPFVQSWFYNENNLTFKKVIAEIYQKSVNTEKFSDTDWFETLDKAYELFSNHEETNVFLNKIYLAAYLCKITENQHAATIFYDIASNAPKKRKFLRYILKKSLYYYFKNLSTRFANETNTNNVCVLKTAINKQRFEVTFVEKILTIIKENLIENE